MRCTVLDASCHSAGIQARVVIDGQEHSRIEAGILVLLGVEKEDTADDARRWPGESSS